MYERAQLVRRGIVLAAGNGDRFRSGSGHSKLLTCIGGTPLLIRTLQAAAEAGITDAHVVVGYDRDTVRAVCEAQAPHGLRLHFHDNPDWHRENGVSVLAARAGVGGDRFALMMGDHIFEPRVLRRLLATRIRNDEITLAVDRAPHDQKTVDEATKVRMSGDRIIGIGKNLRVFDALDTGLFVCSAALFPALTESCAAGDSTLSGGVARLAARGSVRGVDIDGASWCDVDTIEDLETAAEVIGGAPITPARADATPPSYPGT